MPLNSMWPLGPGLTQVAEVPSWGFVTGHDFSRADKANKINGLCPCGMLLHHFNPAPEGDIPLDLARRRLRVWVIPGRVRVILSIDQQIEIASLPLPRASGCSGAGAKILALETLLGKIHVPLDGLRCLAFGNHNAVPGCSRHGFFGCIRFRPFAAQAGRKGNGYDTTRDSPLLRVQGEG